MLQCVTQHLNKAGYKSAINIIPHSGTLFAFRKSDYRQNNKQTDNTASKVGTHFIRHVFLKK